LYARHTPALFALACRLLQADGPDPEDVVQETWLRAVRQLARFDWRSSLRTWLAAILINCCREAWRSAGVTMTSALEDVEQPTEDPHARLDVEHALATLAPGYRSVVVLHDVEGYTHEEIAERLGIDPGTSKSQLSRARRVLRGRLGSGHSPYTV
jgi:RNA polymerase sigma-70 factor (ECF subfamily)